MKTGEPFTTSALSKKVARLFDGNSMDMLRSINCSHFYPLMFPDMKRMEEYASKMGRSVQSGMNYYIKK